MLSGVAEIAHLGDIVAMPSGKSTSKPTRLMPVLDRDQMTDQIKERHRRNAECMKSGLMYDQYSDKCVEFAEGDYWKKGCAAIGGTDTTRDPNKCRMTVNTGAPNTSRNESSSKISALPLAVGALLLWGVLS